MIAEKETSPPIRERSGPSYPPGEKVVGAWTWRGFRPAVTITRDGFTWQGKPYQYADVAAMSFTTRGRSPVGFLHAHRCHLIMRDGEVVSLRGDIEEKGDDPLPASWLDSALPFGDVLHALAHQPPTKAFVGLVRLIRRRASPLHFTPPPQVIVPLSFFAAWLLGGILSYVVARNRAVTEPAPLLLLCLLGSLASMIVGLLFGLWLYRFLWNRRVAALLARLTSSAAPARP